MKWSPEEYEAYLKRLAEKKSSIVQPAFQAPQANAQLLQALNDAKKSGPKYWNVKVYCYPNGIVLEKRTDKFGKPEIFDSRREYFRSVQLRRMEARGEISNLKRQASFLLEPASEYRGQKLRAEYYYADFCYEKNGELVVEDVKAFSEKSQKFRTTELFRSKWNRLKRRYPEIRFVLVDPIANQQR